jgi:hypothetical protein
MRAGIFSTNAQPSSNTLMTFTLSPIITGNSSLSEGTNGLWTVSISANLGSKVGSANGLLSGGTSLTIDVAGVDGSKTLDPVGLFAWTGGAQSVTELGGLEYVEALLLPSFGGLGNAKDSEGENGRTDMGVRTSPPSMKLPVETVRYCAYKSLFWLWTLFAL